jgi:hypothetical protein
MITICNRKRTSTGLREAVFRQDLVSQYLSCGFSIKLIPAKGHEFAHLHTKDGIDKADKDDKNEGVDYRGKR